MSGVVGCEADSSITSQAEPITERLGLLEFGSHAGIR